MSTPLYDIVGTGTKKTIPQVFARFEIPESDLFEAVPGKEIRLYRTAEPLRKFTAKIVRVSPAVGSVSKGIIVEAELGENARELPIGSSVRVEMEKSGNMLLIPSASVVQSEDSKLSVFVIDEQSIVRSKPIVTTRTIGLDVYVVSGIDKEDKIVDLPKNYTFLEDGIAVDPMEKEVLVTPTGAAVTMPDSHKH